MFPYIIDNQYFIHHERLISEEDVHSSSLYAINAVSSKYIYNVNIKIKLAWSI